MSLEPSILWRCTARRLAALVLVALLAPVPASAQDEIGASLRYRKCLTMARTDPRVAHDQAEAWRRTGGGLPARHCAAVSLAETGRYGDAAYSLEAMFDEMGQQTVRARAGVLAQAGHAWVLAGEPVRAHAAFSRGIVLEPENVELLIDRATVAATLANIWEAVDDLNQALDLAPARADALVYRATYYRKLGAAELAHDDLARAFALEPENPEALIERGVLRQLDGDREGARRDWQRVLAVAPVTPAAGFAWRKLQALDAVGGR